MSTDLERRLRETFDEMIPQLIEQVGVVEVVDAQSRPRRWVGVGALAVAACAVALAFVVSRDDDKSTTGVSDTSASATADVPAWYPVLRAAVPERFVYLALTAVGIDGASFVAVDPNDGKALEIVVTGGASPAVNVTCNVDQGQAPFAVAPPECATGNDTQVEPAELAQISVALPGPQLLSLAERPTRTLDGHPLLALITSAVPHGDLFGFVGGTNDLVFELGDQDAVSTRARLLAEVYPRPSVRMHGTVGYYAGLPAFWVIDPSGYAIRFTSADKSEATLRSLQSLADKVLDAVVAQLTAPPVATTSTVVFVEPTALSATFGPITLGDGTTLSLRVGDSGICTLLADGQVGGCDGLVTGEPAVVLWGNDYGTSLQTVYGIVQVGYTVSVTKGDGSPGAPVALTAPQQGWSAYAFQQPLRSSTSLVVTDTAGNTVLTRSLCC